MSKATKCSTSEGKGKERRRPCVTAALTWSLDWSFVSFMQQRNFCFCWFWWREMTEVKHSKLCLHGLNNWTYLMRLTVVCFSCRLVQRHQHQMETVLCFYLQMIQDRVQSSHSNRSFYRTVTQTSQHALCLRAETLRRLPYVMEASHSVSSSVSGFVQSLVPQWDLRVWHLVQRSEHHWTGTGNWDTRHPTDSSHLLWQSSAADTLKRLYVTIGSHWHVWITFCKETWTIRASQLFGCLWRIVEVVSCCWTWFLCGFVSQCLSALLTESSGSKRSFRNGVSQ